LLLIAAGLYLFLILVTYHRSDPGWSHSATEALTRNAGGAFGAWLSDLMLYLFGLSAYWWVALCLYLVVWGWRRMDGERRSARPPGRLAVELVGQRATAWSVDYACEVRTPPAASEVSV